ncbi:hypothetical protein GAYE_SCF23G4294 [Galdieria yellowstonensis]|uniref:Uncharacterized protein n=1 Tax=Galdieria yellowstonensis TaxID=3028027 RepID=A0AAV9IG09_9RHOD|nr:hypothetical protein GAYE_SCF23G4294 [Galdieria yellowstonensis]
MKDTSFVWKSNLRWKLLNQPNLLKLQSLRTLYTNCETTNSNATQDSSLCANSQEVAPTNLRRQWRPATDTTYGRKLLRDWKINAKEDKETLLSLANRLGYYGPSIHRIVEAGDILLLKRTNPERYFSFLRENIATMTPLLGYLYQKAQQEARERSEHLQVYLEVLLCSGRLEDIYQIYATYPPWAMTTHSTLKPCIYIYSMAALWLLGDKERCSALLSKVFVETDVRTKDNFGFGVLEALKNVERLEEALDWLEFCRIEQVALNIPGTFLTSFVDNNDIFMVKKILSFCAENTNIAHLVFLDKTMLQTDKYHYNNASESILKVALFLLENRDWSLEYISEEQLLDVIVHNIRDLETLYGFLDGVCILNKNIRTSWVRKLVQSCKSQNGSFLTPSLLVSFIRRSRIVDDQVTGLALEWAKERMDFESARRILEFLESQSGSISPNMAQHYIQLAAKLTKLDELSHDTCSHHNAEFFGWKEPSQVICHLEDFLQYLESKGTILSRDVLLQIENTLKSCGLTSCLQVIRKRL